MKKHLILLLAILVLVSGCGKKEEKNDNDNKQTEPKVTENNTTNKQESTKKTEESTDKTKSTTTSKSSTKKKTTTKKTTTSANTKVKLGKNEYISLKDNKVHKYTFTYPDEATCVKYGDNEPYDVVYPVKPYMVFGCEKVKDANGNILWGEYFMASTDASSKFYY